MPATAIVQALKDGTILNSVKLLWPLLALILVAAALKLMFHLWEKNRLAKSGIADIDKMDGKTFEKYLEVLFKKLGYKVERTRYVGDYGADLVTAKDGIKVAIQAKRNKRKVGINAVQEAVASKGHYKCDKAMVVTNSYFTKAAKELAKSNHVELWERDQLLNRLLSVNKTETTQVIEQIPTTDNETVYDPNLCAHCGKKVTEAVKKYCLASPQRFGGKVYCYDHQRDVIV